MNIVKNLVVPAIGLSFLLGGVAAFAGDQGVDNGDDNGQGMAQLVGDNAKSDDGTTMGQEDTSTYLVSEENGSNSQGNADDAGTSSTYLIGDNKEDNTANLRLVDHHENDGKANIQLVGDDSSTTTEGDSTDDTSWLV